MPEPTSEKRQDEVITEYLATRIDQTALANEHQKLLGHFAYIVGLLSDCDTRRQNIDLDIRKERQTFGERLASTGQKTSEAAIERQVINHEPYLKLMGELIRMKSAEKKCNLLREGLKWRHEAFIALTNYQASEMKMSRV